VREQPKPKMANKGNSITSAKTNFSPTRSTALLALGFSANSASPALRAGPTNRNVGTNPLASGKRRLLGGGLACSNIKRLTIRSSSE